MRYHYTEAFSEVGISENTKLLHESHMTHFRHNRKLLYPIQHGLSQNGKIGCVHKNNAVGKFQCPDEQRRKQYLSLKKVTRMTSFHVNDR